MSIVLCNACDYKSYMAEFYEEYNKLYFITMQYMQIYDIVLKLNDKETYTNQDYYLERLVDVLNEFYRVFDEKESYYVTLHSHARIPRCYACGHFLCVCR